MNFEEKNSIAKPFYTWKRLGFMSRKPGELLFSSPDNPPPYHDDDGSGSSSATVKGKLMGEEEGKRRKEKKKGNNKKETLAWRVRVVQCISSNSAG